MLGVQNFSGLFAFLPQQKQNASRFVIGALAATALLALSAKIAVPFYPVPATLQTLVVLLLGALCGTRFAIVSLAIYCLEGIFGLPVFAGNALSPGFAYFLGPTGGYLIGFFAGAGLVGLAAERGLMRGFWSILAALAAGHAAIFVFGFAWLSVLVGMDGAFVTGVVPFGAATVFKTLLAAFLVLALRGERKAHAG